MENKIFLYKREHQRIFPVPPGPQLTRTGILIKTVLLDQQAFSEMLYGRALFSYSIISQVFLSV